MWLQRRLADDDELGDVGGGRIIVVDPIDETATALCETFGFHPDQGPGDPLVMKVSTAAAAPGHSPRSTFRGAR